MPYLRAICHAHSEWSYDAQWPLRRIATTFGRLRARLILMTEHDRGFSQDRFDAYRAACAEASSTNVTIIPGIEYSDADNTVHTLTWGLREFLGESLPTLEVLRRVREAGGVAVMAHPARKNAWERYEASWTPLLSGIELWNRKTDGAAPSVEAKRLLRETMLPAFAGLDFHRPRQLFPLWMAIEVARPASEGLEAAVIEAIRARRCRARALGLPLSLWSEGALRPMASGVERLRRGAARVAGPRRA